CSDGGARRPARHDSDVLVVGGRAYDAEPITKPVQRGARLTNGSCRDSRRLSLHVAMASAHGRCESASNRVGEVHRYRCDPSVRWCEASCLTAQAWSSTIGWC